MIYPCYPHHTGTDPPGAQVNKGLPLISLSENTLSLLIRVWIEPREIKDAPVIWRGVAEVTGGPHGQTNTRIAFNNLDDLVEFLSNRLQDLGIPPDQLSRRTPP